MDIAILGAGALGSVIGAHLHKAGLPVTLLDINAAHVEAIQANGLGVDWDDGTEVLPLAAMRPEAWRAADLIVLLTKTYHSDAALRAVSGLIHAGAFVLTIQNGLGNAERVAAHVPRNRVLYGCTMTPGDFVGPGHVASHGASHTPFCALEPSAEAAVLAKALAPAGFEMTDAAPAIVWQKAAFNCAMNATAALGEGPVGAIAAHVGADLAGQVAAETVRLAQTEGVDADPAAVEEQLAFALAHHGDHKPSMLQDMEAGRRTEIAALNRFVASRAQQLGLDVPLNRLLAALVEMKEAVRSN